MVVEALSILRKRAGIPIRGVRLQSHEPSVQIIASKLLAQLALRAKGIQGLQQTGFDEVLRGRSLEANDKAEATLHERDAAEAAPVDRDALRTALTSWIPVWDTLFPAERRRIVTLLVDKVTYDPETAKADVRMRLQPPILRRSRHELDDLGTCHGRCGHASVPRCQPGSADAGAGVCDRALDRGRDVDELRRCGAETRCQQGEGNATRQTARMAAGESGACADTLLIRSR